MEKICFKIESVDDVKANVESVRQSASDKGVLGLAGSIAKKIDDSKDVVKDAGVRLYKVYAQAKNLRDKGGVVDEPVFEFVLEVLDGIIEKSSPEECFEKHSDAFLMDLSNEIETMRLDSIAGDSLLDDPSPNGFAGEGKNADEVKEFLNAIEKAVDDRDQIVYEYGELISLLNRRLNDCGEFDRNRPLNENLPLIQFVRTCAEKRALEKAVQLIEETRAELALEPEEPDNQEVLPEEPQEESVEEFAKNVENDILNESTEKSEIDDFVETKSDEPIEVSEKTDSVETPNLSVAETHTEQEKVSALQENGGSRADVLFVVDASGSMRPCFDQLVAHIKRFVEPFKESGFTSLRLGLLAYSANKNRSAQKIVYRNMFLGPDSPRNMATLYGDYNVASQKFFTNGASIEANVNQFVRRLEQIKCLGDEDTPFAMDCAADFPFEPLNTTRRVAVLFTDERLEDGVRQMESVGERFCTLEKVMNKFSQRHISLYIFAPHSPATEVVEDYPRVFFKDVVACQERRDDTETWESLDIGRVMESLGKSISSSALGSVEEAGFARAIFGQDTWSEDSWN